MDEISNKTLATLLVVAIVISLAGTFFAIRGTQVINQTFLTGFASGQNTTGEARINITETISITLTQAIVDFGEGYRNQTNIIGQSNCNLSTNDAAIVPACWINNTEYNPLDFVLNNDGNILVNVTINSTLPETFLPGPYTGGNVPNYTWTAQHDAAGDDGCTGAQLITDRTQFFNVDQLLCTNLTSDDPNDNINISIQLDVPAGPTGYYNHSVTFIAARNY